MVVDHNELNDEAKTKSGLKVSYIKGVWRIAQ